ncbi:hypothetical protein [Alkalicoccobacillus murimartini]|uniref:Phosphoglyceromutase n=1 Tax=Alkalicoccobacillus murimartini TaxID=171685 RepID=A0ABT9YMW1_9BACI|nr:hypothetical protein [Alkalicoccobacillus murimartini]MDQ0208542.1 hypothetical protein [Alkalicoccobacillus murimartini]
MRIIFLICLFVLSIPYSVEAKPNDSGNSQIVIIVPGMSFEETEWYSQFGNKRLWDQAYIGAMNTKSAGLHSDIGSMVTLASGRKSSSVTGWNGYDVTEIINSRSIKEQYEQLTGYQTSAPIVHPLIAELQRENERTLYKSEVGQFGDRLKKESIPTFTMGTSDTNEQHRFATLLTMDNRGETNGTLSESVIPDPSRAFGLKMNTEWMIQHVNSVSSEGPHFIVIEWGDIYRLQQLKNQMTESSYVEQSQEALVELETFIQTIHDQSDEEIWLLSPFVNKHAYVKKQQLAPVYNWTRGEKGGVFYSETTRRTDVLSNIDIVPTFVQRLGLSSNDYDLGFPLIKTPTTENSSQTLLRSVDQSVSVFESRALVLSIYVSSLAILLLAVGCFTWLGSKKDRSQIFLQTVLLSALSSPLWFLVLAGLETKASVWVFILTLITCSVIWGAVLRIFADVGLAMTIAVTLIVLVIDVVTGSTLLSHSYLGYDPIIGARYYGIGNEYVGIFISFMFVITVYVSRIHHVWTRSLLLVFILGGQLLFLGSSQLGANAGGFLSAGLATLYWLVLYRNVTFTAKKRLLLFITTGVGAILFLYILQLIGKPSHIGTAFGRLFAGDISFIADTIIRKLEMNVKLFKHSNWTQLLVTSYLLAGVILWWKRVRFNELSKQVFIKTGVVCSIILLLINDSGVVAAATSMFCVIATYFYWIQVEERTIL